MKGVSSIFVAIALTLFSVAAAAPNYGICLEDQNQRILPLIFL